MSDNLAPGEHALPRSLLHVQRTHWTSLERVHSATSRDWRRTKGTRCHEGDGQVLPSKIYGTCGTRQHLSGTDHPGVQPTHIKHVMHNHLAGGWSLLVLRIVFNNIVYRLVLVSVKSITWKHEVYEFVKAYNEFSHHLPALH